MDGARDPGQLAARLDLPLLDALRLVASFVIVRHHMRADHLLGIGFGLPLFLVIMFGLASSSTKRESVGHFARRKGAYLIVPWLRWSLIYVAILALADLVRGASPSARFEPEMLFYGGHPMLWFLPFAALVIIPVKLLQGMAAGLTPARATLAASLAGAVATLLASVSSSLPVPEMPFGAWLRVAPAVFWGVAVGQTLRATSDRQRRGLLSLVALVAVVSGCVSLPFDGSTAVALPFAIAVGLACLGFAWSARVPEPIRQLSGMTFGIYLVHPLVGKLLVTGWDVFSWPATVHASAVWCIAGLVVWGLRRASLRWHELSSRPAAGGRAVGRSVRVPSPLSLAAGFLRRG